jgi:hypothetical protein
MKATDDVPWKDLHGITGESIDGVHGGDGWF